MHTLTKSELFASDFLFFYLCLKHAQMSDGFLSTFYTQMMCVVHVFECACVCMLMYFVFKKDIWWYFAYIP